MHYCGYNDSLVRISHGPRTFEASKAKCDVMNDAFRVVFTYSSSFESKLTADQKKYVKGTMKNVKKYLGHLIKCARFRDDYDMTVDVQLTSAGQSGNTIASATSYLGAENPCYRPVNAIMLLNPNYIPEYEPTDEYSGQAGHFFTYVHEMFHALGIGYSIMKYWIDPKTGELLDPDRKIYSTSLTYKGKDFFIIHTPNAHKYAVEKWGKEKFFEGKVDAGIEMQDKTNGKEDLNHPCMRLYRPDLMVSVDRPDLILSHVSLMLLKDTGWWDFNEDMVTTNPWGDASAVGDEPYQGFPDGAQTRDWPERFQYYHSEFPYNDYCDPLYKGSGIVTRTKVDCANPGKFGAYCTMKNFVDPDGRGAVDDATGDFTGYLSRLKTVCATSPPHKFYGNGKSAFCTKSSLTDDGNSYIESGKCFNMSCDDGVLRIHINKSVRVCNFTGQKFRFIGLSGQVVCPNPKHICYLINGPPPKQTPTASLIPTQSEFHPTQTETEKQDIVQTNKQGLVQTAKQENPATNKQEIDNPEQADKNGEENSNAASNSKKAAVISSVVVIIIVAAAVIAIVVFIRIRKSRAAIDDSGAGLRPTFSP